MSIVFNVPFNKDEEKFYNDNIEIMEKIVDKIGYCYTLKILETLENVIPKRIYNDITQNIRNLLSLKK